MNIGFIGIGNMGGAMALNILKAGYALSVYARRREAAKPLLDDGASLSDSPKALAQKSDILFTSLPGPPEVEQIALGKDGVIEGIRPGSIFIDTSTSSPSLIRHIYAEFKNKGAHVLDAPVTGGPPQARERKLTFVVGGDEEIFQNCRPLLDILGAKAVYTGQIGNGSICKLMNNCIAASLQTVVAEVFTAAVKAGVEPKVLLQVLCDSPLGKGLHFQSILPETYFQKNFDPPRFALSLQCKDVLLGTQLAREFNVPMAMVNITLNELMTAVNRGWGGRDARASMLLQEERAGQVEVRI